MMNRWNICECKWNNCSRPREPWWWSYSEWTWYQCQKGCDKIRNQYKGNKIRITLLIEYLKTRTLFEIRITPQARSIMSSLNDYCWSNISHTRTLAWDSNHSTSKIDHVELEWFYMQPKLHIIANKLSHWLKKSTNVFFLYFSSLFTNRTYMALYSLKNETIKAF